MEAWPTLSHFFFLSSSCFYAPGVPARLSHEFRVGARDPGCCWRGWWRSVGSGPSSGGCLDSTCTILLCQCTGSHIQQWEIGDNQLKWRHHQNITSALNCVLRMTVSNLKTLLPKKLVLYFLNHWIR